MPTASLIRAPEPYRNSSIARSRTAVGVAPKDDASRSCSTSSTAIALGRRLGGLGGCTSCAGSVAASPSSRRNRWNPRTATTVRAAEDAVSGAPPSSPVRIATRKAATCSGPTAPGVVTPTEDAKDRYRPRSRRYAASVFAASPRSTVRCSR
jgi:hypothetical protein